MLAAAPGRLMSMSSPAYAKAPPIWILRATAAGTAGFGSVTT